MRKDEVHDQIMARVRDRFEKSGISLHELGIKMDYPPSSARKSAWQFIQKTDDPRISMLIKFSKAMGISVKSLL
jgi:hypothetical protein